MARYEFIASAALRPHHSPAWSCQELADELGIPKASLRALMSFRNGPKPKFVGGKAGNKQSWYDHDEVMEWYAKLAR